MPLVRLDVKEREHGGYRSRQTANMIELDLSLCYPESLDESASSLKIN